MEVQRSVFEVAQAARILNPSDLFSSLDFDLDVNLSSYEGTERSEYSDESGNDIDQLSLSTDPTLSLPDSFDQMIGMGPVTGGVPLRSRVPESIDRRVVSALLKGLNVSEAIYTAIKLKPEAVLTAQDLFNLRLCELILPLRRTLEDTKGSLEAVRQELSLALCAVESQGQELLRYRTLSDLDSQQLVMECESMKVRTAELVRDLASERDLRLQLADKAQRYDTSIGEIGFYRDEVKALRKLMTDQSEITKTLQAEDHIMRARLAEVERERDIFRADKTFLQREVDSSSSSAESYRRRCEELEISVRHAESRSSELSHQLATLNSTDQRGSAQAANAAELERLRELIMKETAAVRLSAEEAMLRENRTLRETILSLQTELSVLRREHAALATESDRISIDFSSRLEKKNFEINELRTNLKIKAFETTSLGVLFEERACALRSRDTEVSRLTEEVAILRAALTKADLETPLVAFRFDDDRDFAEYEESSNRINNEELEIPAFQVTSLADEQMQAATAAARDSEIALHDEMERLMVLKAEVAELQNSVLDISVKSTSSILSPRIKSNSSSQSYVIPHSYPMNMPVNCISSSSSSKSSRSVNSSSTNSPAVLVVEDTEYNEEDSNNESRYSQDGFDDSEPSAGDGVAINNRSDDFHRQSVSSTSDENFGRSMTASEASSTKKRWHERLPL